MHHRRLHHCPLEKDEYSGLGVCQIRSRLSHRCLRRHPAPVAHAVAKPSRPGPLRKRPRHAPAQVDGFAAAGPQGSLAEIPPPPRVESLLRRMGAHRAVARAGGGSRCARVAGSSKLPATGRALTAVDACAGAFHRAACAATLADTAGGTNSRATSRRAGPLQSPCSSVRNSCQAARASSTEPASSIVEMSPGSRSRTTALKTRRMILPLRVLGSMRTKLTSPMTATGPSSRRTVCDQLALQLRRRLVAGAQDDEGGDHLAAQLVGSAADAGLGHRRMAQEGRLDLDRCRCGARRS